MHILQVVALKDIMSGMSDKVYFFEEWMHS